MFSSSEHYLFLLDFCERMTSALNIYRVSSGCHLAFHNDAYCNPQGLIDLEIPDKVVRGVRVVLVPQHILISRTLLGAFSFPTSTPSPPTNGQQITNDHARHCIPNASSRSLSRRLHRKARPKPNSSGH